MTRSDQDRLLRGVSLITVYAHEVYALIHYTGVDEDMPITEIEQQVQMIDDILTKIRTELHKDDHDVFI